MNGLARPHFHFTPASGWMNDPNGLVYLDGEYHLFYQHNPFGIDWGNTSWGHAVSQDLLHWEHLPVAIPMTDGVMAFSGTVVVDWHNTSGFGNGENPPLVAAFTGFDPDTKIQDQRLAYSLDNGRFWHLYQQNPIINLNSTEFRDPKLFWHDETASWMMAVALSAEQQVLFYRSSNLKDWSRAGAFAFPMENAGVWECPDLFPLQTDNGEQKWVLILSIGSGQIKNGSGTCYFVGEFDGYQFTTDAEKPLRLDYGPDFYAVASWNDLPASDGRRIILGWMSHLQYASVVPAEEWRGVQSIPREISLHRDEAGYHLRQQLVRELAAQQQPEMNFSDVVVTDSEQFTIHLPTLPLSVKTECIVGNASQIILRLLCGKKTLIVRYEVKAKMAIVDRSQTGYKELHPSFRVEFVAPLEEIDGAISLQLVMDSCSVELFGNNGRITLSTLFDFEPDQQIQLAISAIDGDVKIKSLCVEK